jgi:hypothetical protein
MKIIKVIKAFAYTLLFAVLFSSCIYRENKNDTLSTNHDIQDIKIVVIDSCEYIQYHTYSYESITHKGNCKYCIEREIHSIK